MLHVAGSNSEESRDRKGPREERLTMSGSVREHGSS